MFIVFQRVPIDSCVLWEDSGFLQQASDVTGGVYIKTPEPSGLLQYLLVSQCGT